MLLRTKMVYKIANWCHLGGFPLPGAGAGQRLQKGDFQGSVIIFSTKLLGPNFLMCGLRTSRSVTDTSKEAATEGLKKFYAFTAEKLELAVNHGSARGCWTSVDSCAFCSPEDVCGGNTT